jgi:hypothetical protein
LRYDINNNGLLRTIWEHSREKPKNYKNYTKIIFKKKKKKGKRGRMVDCD